MALNLVPPADGTKTVGTILKRWLSGFFRWLNIDQYIDFVNTSNPIHSEGRVFYDNDQKTLSIYNENSEVTHNLGQEHLMRVRNESGADINNGKIVRILGANGEGHPCIVLAKADIEDTSHAIGVTTSLIPNNGNGYVTLCGKIHDLDTSSFSQGDVLYLSDTIAGGFTTTKPDIVTLVGFVLVIHATQGIIYATVQEYGAVGSDMLKSVYDPDVDGVVDRASSVSIFARKASVGSIAKGKPVYLTGYNVGNWVEVEEADATDSAKIPAIGLTTETLTDSATSKIVVFGRLIDVDTSSYSLGDSLFISTTPGELTNVKPQGNNYIQKVAQVLKVHATEGIIEIFGTGRINDVPNFYPYTEKVTPHIDDTLLLEDSEDSYNKKKLKINNLQLHTHLNKSELDLLTDGDHDVRTDNPHAVTSSQIGSPTDNEIYSNYIEDNGISSTTSNTYQQKLKLTFTPPEVGNYEICFSCLVSHNDADRVIKTRIQIDDTTTKKEVLDTIRTKYANGGWRSRAGHFIVNLTASSHDIDIDFCSENLGKTSYIKEAVITVRRIS